MSSRKKKHERSADATTSAIVSSYEEAAALATAASLPVLEAMSPRDNLIAAHPPLSTAHVAVPLPKISAALDGAEASASNADLTARSEPAVVIIDEARRAQDLWGEYAKAVQGAISLMQAGLQAQFGFWNGMLTTGLRRVPTQASPEPIATANRDDKNL